MKPKTVNGKMPNFYDLSLGISPHMLKEAKLGNTCYHLGLCSAGIERDML